MQQLGKFWLCRWMLMATLCVADLFCMGEEDFAEAAEFSGTWEYCIGESAGSVDEDRAWLKDSRRQEQWETFSFPQKPAFSADVQNLGLTTKLLPHEAKNDTLFFMTLEQSLRVWLDDQDVYEYGGLKSVPFGYGWRWHEIVLPPLEHEAQLTFQMYGSDPQLLGHFMRMELNTEVEQAKKIYMSDLPYLLAFPIAIILLIIMMAYYVKRIVRRRLCLNVIAFLLAFLFWLLAVSNVKFYLLDYPVFWWYALSFLAYLLPIFLHMIIYESIEQYLKSWLRNIIFCYAILFLFAFVGELVGLHGFNRCMGLYYLLIVFLEPIAFILVLSSASGGNAYSRSMILPLLSFTVLSLVDGFLSHFYVLEWQSFFLG